VAEIVTAIFHGGSFAPDQPPAVPDGARVRLIVDVLENPAVPDVHDDFDALCDRLSVNSGGARMTRDELHERH
jgi:predicted DNA-binding antitoxin AbrB/MazE fold protein